MIHNGIEYGMMQAYGEGFELLKASRLRPRSGENRPPVESGERGALLAAGVGRERFCERCQARCDQRYVEDSGEGRWTVEEAIDKSVPAPVLMLSLFARFASRQDDSFSAKVVAALRNEFGGHTVKRG